MTAQELLCLQIQRNTDQLFRAARAIPAEKLDWKPSPEMRSALDQLQEIATADSVFKSSYVNRELDWSPDLMGQWLAERSKYTDLDELEKMTRESNAKLCEYIMSVDDDYLSQPVKMPFPGEFDVAYIFSYYPWNMAYHEGQITAIGMRLQDGA